MKGDLHPVALRLSSQLPCRTHERRLPAIVQGSKQPPKVQIGHVVYPSVAEAARRLGKSRSAITLMIDRGRARYA